MLKETKGPVFSTFRYTKDKEIVHHSVVVKGAFYNTETGEQYVVFNHKGKTEVESYNDFARGTFLDKSDAVLLDYSKPTYK